MNREIVFITSNNGFFGQTRKPWVSMDSDRIAKRLIDRGFRVKKMTLHQAINDKNPIKDSIVFYTFSQKENIRSYIIDLIWLLDDGSNFLIPSFDFLKCHEDKGYQELFKRKLGIEDLSALYFSCLEDIEGYDLTFPIVFKTIDGSNGKGVKLISSKDELVKVIKSNRKITFLDKIDIIRRRYFRKKKSYKEYPDYTNEKDLEQYIAYITNEKCFVLQQYVPDLDCDYRVLAINDKYFVTKRLVNDGDFRASGTKRFVFDFPLDETLLDYIKELKDKFDTPFFSTDVGFKNGKYHLFEYQALHFGLNVYVKSNVYYYKTNDGWQKQDFKPDIEMDIADGLAGYLDEKLNRI